MLSGKYNITIESGSTFDMDLALTDDGDSIIDLTGYSASMQIRNSVDLLILDCDQYINVNNTNHITIEIPSTITNDISLNDAFYQIEIKIGSKEYSLMRGSVEFLKRIIKS